MLIRQSARRRLVRHGFTLMELLVVMAILLILAGTSILVFRGYYLEAKISTAEQMCVQLKGQLETFAMSPSQGGMYPDEQTGFEELVARGFLVRSPTDPWNMPYRWGLQTLADGATPQAVVWSSGPNGIDEGGSGDDITSE